MHDIVIPGGTILDGTGAPGFTGDGGIEGECIGPVSGRSEPARLVRAGR
jgi:N-acyl-D-aspartate/D-glutamate deacylase